MNQRDIFKRLWELGWSKGLTGLWYRPFPNNRKAGLIWKQAAVEINVMKTINDPVVID